MIIKSKFNTTCKVCNGPVSEGMQVNWEPSTKGVTHVDSIICKDYKIRAMMLEDKPKPHEPNTKLLPLIELIKSVDLKRPTLRLRFGDTPIVISTTQGGHAPGSLAIKVNGEFIGCVRPNGQMTGKLAMLTAVQDYLLSISNDKDTLIKEAVLYGKFTNSCSFCGLELTHDYSVMVGYGPICAENWGLPHAYNGTADDVPNLPANAKKKFMELMMEEDND